MAGLALALLAAALVASVGFGQAQDHSGHGAPVQETNHGTEGGHSAGPAEGAAMASPAAAAYRAANLAMHRAMEMEFSGDADLDFARGMIGHHQGAIDMARVVLEHGKDPELRKLAEQIIESQEAEIAFLRAWVAEHGE